MEVMDMPIIHVELVEGRTKEQKKQLGEAITKATVDIVKVPVEAVKVIFVDMKADEFMEGGVLRSERK
jgi:4-oxalocrotonate tautomerase